MMIRRTRAEVRTGRGCVLPNRACETCRQLAVARDHVADIRRAKSVALMADAVERGLRPQPGGSRVLPGTASPPPRGRSRSPVRSLVGKIARYGDGDGEVDRDDQQDGCVECARKKGLGVAHVGGGVGDEAKALITDEEYAGAEEDRLRVWPEGGREIIRFDEPQSPRRQKEMRIATLTATITVSPRPITLAPNALTTVSAEPRRRPVRRAEARSAGR